MIFFITGAVFNLNLPYSVSLPVIGLFFVSFLSVFLFCAIGVLKHPRLVRKVLLAMAGIVCLLGLMLSSP